MSDATDQIDHPDHPDLPPAVTAYFAAQDGRPADALDLFAPDADVTDDGHRYRGRGEVLDWLTGPAAASTVTATHLGADVSGDRAEVLVRLEGDFPGGVVDLCHDFQLDAQGLIAALVIEP